MENILWNTWQYLVDVFDCFLILYLFRRRVRIIFRKRYRDRKSVV